MTKPSSKEFLETVLSPHMDLSLSLLKIVESTSTEDPSYRYQIAAIITFLSGIDKTLSLFYQLLYISGKIPWKEIAPRKDRTPIGYIECQWGLTKKIIELENFGVDISDLRGIVELRNAYMHDSYIYAGYSELFDFDSNQPYLGGTELSFRTVSPPMTYFTPELIRFYQSKLIENTCRVLDSNNWLSSWKHLDAKLKQLPTNPEPEFSQLGQSHENLHEIIESLNKRFIGHGANKLLGTATEENS